MADLYSKVYTYSIESYFSYSMRTHVSYSTTTTNSAVTVKATIELQLNGTFPNTSGGSPWYVFGNSYVGKQSGSSWSNVKTFTTSGHDYTTKGATYSSWTTVKTTTYTVELARSTSAQTYKIAATMYWNQTGTSTPNTYYTNTEYLQTASISVPALPSYTVSYNGNGSTGGSTSSQTKYYGVSLTLRSNGFTKTGYTFSKWNTKSDGTGTAYNAGASYTGNAALALYARWTANTYYVKYNANGGSGTMSNSTHTYGTAKALTANAFTKTGYTITYNHNGSGASNVTATSNMVFSKWNTKSDGSGTAYSNKQSVSNLTATAGGTVNLYAQWSNGSITLRTPTWTGHTFGGWYSEAACTNKVGNGGASYTVTGNKTLYAKWTTNTYSVTPDANGGTLNSGCTALTKTYGVDLTLWASSKNPTRTGYDFVKWNTAANGSGTDYAAGGVYKANSAVTLYAQWAKKTYSVTYNANGGSGTTAAQTKTHGTDLTLRSNGFSRSNFSFKRWNTNSNDTGTGYNAGATYTANAAVTLYAIWNRTVTYNANGGSGAPSAQTAVATSAITLATATPTRDGYAFSKWNTKSDGSGTNYNSGGSYPANSGSVTLYAVWTPIVSSLTIGAISAIRVETSSSTEEADEGTYAYIKIPFTCKGAASATITLTSVTAIAESGATPSITLVDVSENKAADSVKTGTLTAVASGCDVNVRYSFTALVTAVNTYTTQTDVTATKTVILPQAFFTLDVLAGGHGIGIGKPATREALDIGMPIYADDILYMESSNIDRNGAAPASNTTGSAYLRFIDKDGACVGTVHSYRVTSKDMRTYLTVRNENSEGSEITKAVYLALAQNGGTRFHVPTLLVIQNTVLDRDGANPSSNTNADYYLRFEDKNSEYIGSVYPRRLTTGEQRLVYAVFNEKTDGTQVSNSFSLGVQRDGTRTFAVDDTASFRNGINAVGCGNQSTINASLDALNTADQIWAIWANCTNANNTDENGHRIGLCLSNYGVFGYRTTTGGATAKTLWSFTTQNTSASGTSVITIATNHTLDTATYCARNGVVQVRIVFKTSSTATGSRTIGTIASGKRPAAMIYGSTTSTIMSSCSVEYSGAVKVYFNTAPSTSTTYGISFVYLLPSGDQT